MPLLPPSENSDEWLERKHIANKCSQCGVLYDIKLGHKCEKPKIIRSVDFDPNRVCRIGYKYSCSNYWRKLEPGYEHSSLDDITRTDNEGVWVKVDKYEATTPIITIEQPEPLVDRDKLLKVKELIKDNEKGVELPQPIIQAINAVTVKSPHTSNSGAEYGEQGNSMLGYYIVAIVLLVTIMVGGILLNSH